MTVGSLAYRTHTADIWDGRAPEKYRRLLPYIAGKQILEIGAAEGVLSLLLADRDPSARVTALELRPERQIGALALQERWRALGRRVDGCTMLCGDIRDRFDLLEGVDTLVAIRTLYHLRGDIDRVLAEVAQHVSCVVLAGNPNRARRYADAQGAPSDALGAFNVYASVGGMRAALERAGYTISRVVAEGDPIVIGHR